MTDAEIGRRLRWSPEQIRAFREQVQAPMGRLEQCARRGIRVSTQLDAELPGWAAKLHSTPWLFYRGDLAMLESGAIGFSGSRDATEIAIGLTRAIVKEAIRQGMTVVSGGARGIDMTAHAAALEAGGATVVLIPQGLETWRAPTLLADPDAQDRTLIVSYDMPWAPWTTVSAMQRNRAIVDLSDVMTIPLARTSGGSHSTGMYALGQKRDLWVADLGDDAPGNQLLLQRGARHLPLVDGAPDIDQMRAPQQAAPTQQSLF